MKYNIRWMLSAWLVCAAATSTVWAQATAAPEAPAKPAVTAPAVPTPNTAAPSTAAPNTGAPSTAPAAEAPVGNKAIIPVPKDEKWKVRHESFNAKAKQGNIDVVFIGDSITQGWEGSGKGVWAERYTPRKALNLGIGGDRTQHVLWRLDNGNLEGIQPKVAVVMIGTNNSNGKDHTAAEIAEGIKAIVAKLQTKLPETKILLLAIFPRGEKPNPQREKNAEASKLASEVADGKNVVFLDIGPKFLTEDGLLSKEIMPDYLHLSPKGYQIWADAIEEPLAGLLQEKR